MTPLEQLQAHRATRPIMPRPFIASDPECIAFHLTLQAWVER